MSKPSKYRRPAIPIVEIEGQRLERADALEGTELELRGENSPARIVGHGVPFNVETELYSGYFEVIEPGAFTRSIRERPDVLSLYNHNINLLLGRSTTRSGAGSLEVWEDELGLAYRTEPIDTPTIRDQVLAPMRAKLIRGSSVAMHVEEAREETRSESVLRRITRATLIEVGPVLLPQYAEADAQLRSLALQGAPAETILPALRERPGLTAEGVQAMLESVLAELRADPAPRPGTQTPTPSRALLERALELAELED